MECSNACWSVPRPLRGSAIDPAEFIHEPLRAEVAQAQGKLGDIAFDTLEQTASDQ